MTTIIRCPIHGHIELSTEEKAILDCPLLGRLEHVSQMGMVRVAAKRAVHSRLSHSLGTMYVAGLLFDALVINHRQHANFFQYWRRILRLAALLHDLGHAPFSHSLEALFGDHEVMTSALIFSLPLSHEDKNIIAKLATGPGTYPEYYTRWEKFMSSLITGAVGVDRVDYALRDSFYLGFKSGIELTDIRYLRLVVNESESAWLEEDGDFTLASTPAGLNFVSRVAMTREKIVRQYHFHEAVRASEWHLRSFLRNEHESAALPIDPDEFSRIDDRGILSNLSVSKSPEAIRLKDNAHYVNIFYPRLKAGGDVFFWFAKFQERFGDSVVLDVSTKPRSSLVPTWDGKTLRDPATGPGNLNCELILVDPLLRDNFDMPVSS